MTDFEHVSRNDHSVRPLDAQGSHHDVLGARTELRHATLVQ